MSSGQEGFARSRPSGLVAVGQRVGWGIADQIIFSVVSFALSIAVAHLATPRQFGAFGIAYVVYTLVLGTLEALTAEVVVVRGAHLTGDARHRMLAQASGMALACGLVLSLVGAAFLFVGHGPAARVIPPIFIPAPLLFVQDVWRYGFFASVRPQSAVGNDGLWACLLAIGLVVGLGVLHGDWMTAIWVWSGAGAVCGAVGAVQIRCMPRPDWSIGWMRQQRRVGARFAGEFLALYGAAQAVLIWVGAFAGLAQSAGYRGGQLLFGPVQVLLNAVRLAVTPLLARAQERGETQSVWQGALVVACIGGAAALSWGIVLRLLPASIGAHILGRSWTATRGVLLPMSVTNLSLGLGMGALVLLRIKSAFRASFKIRTLAAVGVVTAGGIGAVNGPAGAADGVALVTAVMTWMLWRQAARIRDSGGAG